MKIILRDNYKRTKDEVVLKNVKHALAKKLVLVMNNSNEFKVVGKFYQVVNDEYQI